MLFRVSAQARSRQDQAECCYSACDLDAQVAGNAVFALILRFDDPERFPGLSHDWCSGWAQGILQQTTVEINR
jgi:hypothetical protein